MSPPRLILAQQVRVLEQRVRDLMRASSARVGSGPAIGSSPAESTATPVTAASGRAKVVFWVSRDRTRAGMAQNASSVSGVRLVSGEDADVSKLDTGLADADLVICQAGCVSHGDWWRVRDYCSRTGKQCILVDEPNALARVTASKGQTTGEPAT